MKFRNLFFALPLLSLSSTVFAAPSNVKTFESEGQKVRYEEIVDTGNDVVWGFDFLPDGRMIATTRGGQFLVIDLKTKIIAKIKGAPEVFSQGQGGLLDVRVHPDGKWIYYTYSEPKGHQATTALARAVLSGNELTQTQKLFSAEAPNMNDIHFGSRIEFDKKGHVFISVGERNKREQVQDLSYHLGKIIRLNEDGSVPKDNPFVNKAGAKPEIWNYGLRNPQGLAMDPVSGELYEAEMGPRGGDEINLMKPGANYGWPIITYGREYHGPKIGEGTEKPGVTNPVAYWVPSISPSALGFYNGNAFPKWKGNAFLATLSGSHLRRLVMENGKVTKQEELLKDIGLRFRNVRQGPDGHLYVSTDDGLISKLSPAG